MIKLQPTKPMVASEDCNISGYFRSCVRRIVPQDKYVKPIPSMHFIGFDYCDEGADPLIEAEAGYKNGHDSRRTRLFKLDR